MATDPFTEALRCAVYVIASASILYFAGVVVLGFIVDRRRQRRLRHEAQRLKRARWN